MDAEAGRIRAHRVVGTRDLRDGGTPFDYVDSFAVGTSEPDARSAEQWFREVFEAPPAPLRWFLLVGWRGVLGLRLGPRPSPDHVLGWRIVSVGTDTARLELRSTSMTAQLELRLCGSTAVWNTQLRFKRRRARPLWTTVGVVHRHIVPRLLDRAASRPSAGLRQAGEVLDLPVLNRATRRSMHEQ